MVEVKVRTTLPLVVPDEGLHAFMKSHVYIGYSNENKAVAAELYESIDKRGFVCMLRNSIDITEESTLQNIKQGVLFSHKCLLYVTRDYLNDENSKYELIEAEGKVKYLGQNSVVAFVESSVPEEELEKLKQFSVIRLKPNQTCFLEEHLWRISDFRLKPTLSSMPKENLGVGVAYTYFYGYLQLILPGIGQALEKELNRYSIEFDHVVSKFLIIIPEDVNSPPDFRHMIDKRILKQTNHTIKICAHRSGREKRDYTVPVYELTVDDGRRETFYFAGDVPACLFALREDYDCGMSNLKEDELYQARNEFVLCLEGFLTHPDRRQSYEHQWEILAWPNIKTNPNWISLPEFLHEQIVTKKLTEKFPEMKSLSISGPVQATPDTFVLVPAEENQPSYRDLPRYELRPNQRGYCVIINNSKFPQASAPERTGAAEENEMLKRMFTDLHFLVKIYEDLTADDMRKILRGYQSDSKQTEYDAFACCILSHGTLGSVTGADGQDVMVAELMNLFFEENCPSLKGKPKMFFIGACQAEGGVSSDVSYASETAPGPSDTSETGLKKEASPDFTYAPEKAANLTPSTLDFIVSYATMPYRVAYADSKSGGLYVKALYKFLPTHKEIDLALREVNREVKRHLQEYSIKHNRSYQQETYHCITPPYKSLFLGGF